MSLLQNTTQMRCQALIPTILSADAVERLDRDFSRPERLVFGLIFSGREQTRRIDGHCETSTNSLGHEPLGKTVLPWHFKAGIVQREREYLAGGREKNDFSLS